MKKWWLLSAVSVLAWASACSIQSPEADPVQVRNYQLTGNSAVDSSLPFLSLEELEMFQLLAEDSEQKLSIQGNIGPNTGNLAVNIYGPLHDQRLVKGKKIAISLYKGNGGLTGKWTVHYGYASQGLNYTAPLSQSTYGNYVVFIDLDHASMFYFKVVSEDGTVVDNQGEPFAARMYDSIVSYALKDGKLTVNYSGASSENNTRFHIGWNNWSQTADYSSSFDNWPIHKYAQPGGYNHVTIDVPWWANYLDFAVYGNGQWDNNRGLDYHTSIRPLVTAQVSSYWNAKKQVNLYYAGGSLNPVKAHYGNDGWQNVNTENMYYNYAGQWNIIVQLPEDADILNTVFTDGAGNWNNNFGMNWNLPVNPAE